MKRSSLLTLCMLFVTLCLSVSTAQAKDNSKYYKDIVFQEGDDFLGISFGMSMDSVMMMLPDDALDSESYDYLTYYWQLDNGDYYIDLYFDNGELNSIDGSVFFFDKNDKADKDEADLLYKDMLANFTDKYGAEVEERMDGMKYTYWYKDDLDAEVGRDGGEVYWYLYDYSYDSYDYYEDVEATPLLLEDVEMTKDGFYGLGLGDSRVKVKSKIAEEHFYDSGLNELMYQFEEGSNMISINFVFDNEDKVNVIDGYIDFPYSYYYDWEIEGSEDSENHKVNFYNEYREMLTKNYGERKEKHLSDGRVLTTWRFDGKELILTMDDYAVYFIYAYDE